MGLTIAPIEIHPFQLVPLVLELFLVVPEPCGILEVMKDISPPDTGWGIAALVTKGFMLIDEIQKQNASSVIPVSTLTVHLKQCSKIRGIMYMDALPLEKDVRSTNQRRDWAKETVTCLSKTLAAF